MTSKVYLHPRFLLISVGDTAPSSSLTSMSLAETHKAPVPDLQLGARINIPVTLSDISTDSSTTYAPLLANMYVGLTRRMQA